VKPSQIAVLAKKHWLKRWAAPGRLDRYLGGRNLGTGNRSALDAILALPARTVLELGPGCYRFARVATEAGLEVSAVELPIPRAAGLRPAAVATWFSWRPWPLPWPDDAFDVVYQQNAVPNLPSRSIMPCLRELMRLAPVLVWSGDLRPRFWEDGKAKGGERAAWMEARLGELFDVERRRGKLLILRRRHARGISRPTEEQEDSARPHDGGGIGSAIDP
jgi:hypothetical protein